MASAQMALPALLLLAALYVAPPCIGLAAALRRSADLRRRGLGPSAWVRAGTGFAAAALLINIGVTAALLRSTAGDGIALGRIHVLAALLSWGCFWFWIALLIFVRRRRRARY